MAEPDTFVFVAATDPLAAPLFAELAHEYSTRYGDFFGEDPAVELARYPADRFSRAEGGAFVLLLREGVAIAGGAFMRFDESTVELKRIWASAAHRRQGLARRVVVELEDEARRQGYARAYLTTGPRQPEAKSLYFRTGYTPLFDVSLEPEQVVIHGFAKGLTPAGDDLSGVIRAHEESLAEFLAAHPAIPVGGAA
ncbi:GNAT family N-acetyltransferase [Subtercola boreus]|uniref:GNAT family N-acetyltransferase n=1 Tax=Subtercola boreus TaxID=120213 RepID=UPI00116AEE12|nr:GNAT family N-acetyltransferase [Subtercola boreus]TQL53748.1 putative GNAT family acetyltransferase [Subtercola boreus]